MYKDVEYIKNALIEEGASASSDDEETKEAPDVEEVKATALGVKNRRED